MIWAACFCLILVAVVCLRTEQEYQPPLEFTMLRHQKIWAGVKEYLGQGCHEQII